MMSSRPHWDGPDLFGTPLGRAYLHGHARLSVNPSQRPNLSTSLYRENEIYIGESWGGGDGTSWDGFADSIRGDDGLGARPKVRPNGSPSRGRGRNWSGLSTHSNTRTGTRGGRS